MRGIGGFGGLDGILRQIIRIETAIFNFACVKDTSDNLYRTAIITYDMVMCAILTVFKSRIAKYSYDLYIPLRICNKFPAHAKQFFLNHLHVTAKFLSLTTYQSNLNLSISKERFSDKVSNFLYCSIRRGQ